jgi:hypothetical protein
LDEANNEEDISLPPPLSKKVVDNSLPVEPSYLQVSVPRFKGSVNSSAESTRIKEDGTFESSALSPEMDPMLMEIMGALKNVMQIGNSVPDNRVISNGELLSYG